MNITNAGKQPPSPLQPAQSRQTVGAAPDTSPTLSCGQMHSVDPRLSPIPDCDQLIESLTLIIVCKVDNIGSDIMPSSEIKKLFSLKLKILITNYGHQKAVQFLSQWPEDKKGQTWFHLLANFLFNNRESSICKSMIAGLTPHKDSTKAPIVAYIAVLEKLQAENALHSPEGFKKFMDWLVSQKLSEVYPRTDLLKKIPECLRKICPNLPIISGQGISMVNNPGWGEFTYSLHYYLAHTQWIQHCMIFAFIEQAPVDFVQPVIEGWLETDDTAIRDKLFAQTQHPLGIPFPEPRPWSIMLAALDRLLPRLESPLSRDISALDGSNQRVKKIDRNLTGRLRSFRKSFVFGRTIAFIHPAVKSNLYLKFQSKDESDKMFFQEAQRLKYFYKNERRFGITGSALSVEGVFKTDSLRDTLSKYSLSDTDKALLSWRCARNNNSSILDKALSKTTSPKAIENAKIYAEKTNWYNLLANDTPLSTDDRKTLIDYLKKIKTSCHMMLLQAPAGYYYEQYIYDTKSRDSVVKGLVCSTEEYGTMWSENVLGAELCSSFHDKDTGRRYCFLPLYFDRHAIGLVNQWASLSTDFPNVGPMGCRDRGDSMAVSELDIKKLFASPEEEIGVAVRELDTERLLGSDESGGNHDKLLARGSLEALARAAWGSILLYGRSLRETFDSDDIGKVTMVKEDVGVILGTLFSKAFHIPLEKCLEYMNSQDLLTQTAREMSYWMTTDYVADLRNGRIPETVYPDYQGIRDGHVLASEQVDFLSDDGFKGDYPSIHLGARSGINPLIALDALVVKMLTHGCLNLFKIQK